MGEKINLALKPDERGAVIGQTGTGKTFLSRQLLPRNYPLAIIDPKRMFKYDTPIYERAADILREKPERFTYRPSADMHGNIHELDLVYKYCYDHGDICVYTDDLVGIFDNNKFPEWLKKCYQLGRERNVSMLTCFQRPSWVPLFTMTEACKFYIFTLTLKEDIKRVCQLVPNYKPSVLPDKHHFFYHSLYDDTSLICTIKKKG